MTWLTLPAVVLGLFPWTQETTNLQYEYWAGCKVGSWVKVSMEIETGGKKAEYESYAQLTELSAERAIVMTAHRLKQNGKLIDSQPIRQEIKAKDPQQGKILMEKDEDVTVGGKTLKCRYYEVESETTVKDKKVKTLVKAWMSREIPGGAAKAEVTSTQEGSGPIKTVALEWEKK